MNIVKTPNEIDVEYWRSLFDDLYKKHPNFTRKQLSNHDNYFQLAIGKDDINHVKKGRAGLVKTRRVVMALQKAIEKTNDSNESIKKLMRRQNLSL